MPALPDQLNIKVEILYPGFSLEVAEEVSLDGVTALFGPSGAGKSTLLRIICGIERGARGLISFRDQDWQNGEAGVFLPPHRRGAVMVFQNPQLFPHLSVEGNLRYGHRRRQGRTGPSWDDVFSALELGAVAKKPVEALSGGERQRVALGRALLAAPNLLLLDEPLAAIDENRKQEILPYIRSAISVFGIPVIYVSHSAEETAALARSVLMIENGRIVQKGGTGLFKPGSAFAQLRAVVSEKVSEDLFRCRVGQSCILGTSREELATGTDVILGVNSKNVTLLMDGNNTAISAGQLSAVVETVQRFQDESILTVSTAGGDIRVEIPHAWSGVEQLRKGIGVKLLLRTSCQVIRKC